MLHCTALCCAVLCCADACYVKSCHAVLQQAEGSLPSMPGASVPLLPVALKIRNTKEHKQHSQALGQHCIVQQLRLIDHSLMQLACSP